MAKMSTVMIVKDTEPVNSVCLTADSLTGWLAEYDGTTVVSDAEDDFGTEYITLTGCIAVDVTGLDPMPGIGNGWSYVKGAWVAPVASQPVAPGTV
jgi:hypothetical protein